MNDNKVAEMWPTKVNRKCSFCGTTEAQSKSFIASNTSNHCICDKCIKQGKMLLNKDNIVTK
jgi:ATP-dependent protease Clp ATPase subunit